MPVFNPAPIKCTHSIRNERLKIDISFGAEKKKNWNGYEYRNLKWFYPDAVEWFELKKPYVCSTTRKKNTNTCTNFVAPSDQAKQLLLSNKEEAIQNTMNAKAHSNVGRGRFSFDLICFLSFSVWKLKFTLISSPPLFIFRFSPFSFKLRASVVFSRSFVAFQNV